MIVACLCGIVLAQAAALPPEPAEVRNISIRDETIDRPVFDAELQAGIDTRGLAVHAGVAVHADRVRIRLHEITGSAQFRGSFAPVTSVLSLHHLLNR